MNIHLRWTESLALLAAVTFVPAAGADNLSSRSLQGQYWPDRSVGERAAQGEEIPLISENIQELGSLEYQYWPDESPSVAARDAKAPDGARGQLGTMGEENLDVPRILDSELNGLRGQYWPDRSPSN